MAECARTSLKQVRFSDVNTHHGTGARSQVPTIASLIKPHSIARSVIRGRSCPTFPDHYVAGDYDMDFAAIASPLSSHPCSPKTRQSNYTDHYTDYDDNTDSTSFLLSESATAIAQPVSPLLYSLPVREVSVILGVRPQQARWSNDESSGDRQVISIPRLQQSSTRYPKCEASISLGQMTAQLALSHSHPNLAGRSTAISSEQQIVRELEKMTMAMQHMTHLLPRIVIPIGQLDENNEGLENGRITPAPHYLADSTPPKYGHK